MCTRAHTKKLISLPQAFSPTLSIFLLFSLFLFLSLCYSTFTSPLLSPSFSVIPSLSSHPLHSIFGPPPLSYSFFFLPPPFGSLFSFFCSTTLSDSPFSIHFCPPPSLLHKTSHRLNTNEPMCTETYNLA